MKGRIKTGIATIFLCFCCNFQILAQREYIILDSVLNIDSFLIFDKEVIIEPGAFFTTSGHGLIQFNAKVHFPSDIFCFSPDANLKFSPGTLDEINPCWFGAISYDDFDDTKSIQKAVGIAKEYYGSISIVFPLGKYYLNATIEVESDSKSRKSIHFKGMSHSNSAIQGSSIIWNGNPGESMFVFKQVNQFQIENMDFTAEPGHYVKHNLEFRPFIHQVTIENCRFTGSSGMGSSCVNLNEGNNLQVSEFHFANCTFSGIIENGQNVTEAAVRGGRANTKNFHFRDCAFSSFSQGAIDILNSDVLQVNGCTFAHNNVDIRCMVCGTYAVSNYSEHSISFFEGASTSNVSFTTMINNLFAGDTIKTNFVIRDGSGSLILMNNNFGGAGNGLDVNRVRWENKPFNPIYSVGNFFKNTTEDQTPFFDRSNNTRTTDIYSSGNIGGKNSSRRIKIKNNNR